MLADSFAEAYFLPIPKFNPFFVENILKILFKMPPMNNGSPVLNICDFVDQMF